MREGSTEAVGELQELALGEEEERMNDPVGKVTRAVLKPLSVKEVLSLFRAGHRISKRAERNNRKFFNTIFFGRSCRPITELAKERLEERLRRWQAQGMLKKV